MNVILSVEEIVALIAAATCMEVTLPPSTEGYEQLRDARITLMSYVTPQLINKYTRITKGEINDS